MYIQHPYFGGVKVYIIKLALKSWTHKVLNLSYEPDVQLLVKGLGQRAWDRHNTKSMLAQKNHVSQVNNAEAEVAKAADYPMIRLFTAALEQSTTPVDELLGVSEPWSVASSSKLLRIPMLVVSKR